MTTLTLDAMQALHGAQWWKPPRGALCGFLGGAVFGLVFTGRFVSAAFVYMVTPTVCFFDYAS